MNPTDSQRSSPRNINFFYVFFLICFVPSLLTSLALVAYSNWMTVVSLAPLVLLVLMAGFKFEGVVLPIFLGLIPLSGALDNLLGVKAIPVLVPVLFAGAIGHAIRNLRSQVRPEQHLPVVYWLMLINLLISATWAFFSLRRFLPHMHAVVSDPPWGHVSLINAFGWIARASALTFSGLVVFAWLLERPQDGIEKKYLKAIFAGFCMSFFLGFAQYMRWTAWNTVPQFTLADIHQYNATFSDPNALGLCAALMFPLCVARLFESRKDWLAWLSGIVLIFLLSISGSRSSFVIICVGLFVLFVAMGFHGQKLFLKIALLLFLVISGWFVFYLPSYEGNLRAVSLVKRVRVNSNNLSLIHVLFGDREMLWKAGWVTFQKNPLLGVGMGTYLIKMPLYKDRIGVIYNDNPGSMYLQIAAEQGLVGLLCFLCLLAYPFWNVFRHGLKRATILQVGAFSSLVGSFVAFFFGAHLISFEINILFWFLLSQSQKEHFN